MHDRSPFVTQLVSWCMGLPTPGSACPAAKYLVCMRTTSGAITETHGPSWPKDCVCISLNGCVISPG